MDAPLLSPQEGGGSSDRELLRLIMLKYWWAVFAIVFVCVLTCNANVLSSLLTMVLAILWTRALTRPGIIEKQLDDLVPSPWCKSCERCCDTPGCDSCCARNECSCACSNNLGNIRGLAIAAIVISVAELTALFVFMFYSSPYGYWYFVNLSGCSGQPSPYAPYLCYTNNAGQCTYNCNGSPSSPCFAPYYPDDYYPAFSWFNLWLLYSAGGTLICTVFNITFSALSLVFIRILTDKRAPLPYAASERAAGLQLPSKSINFAVPAFSRASSSTPSHSHPQVGAEKSVKYAAPPNPALSLASSVGDHEYPGVGE